ncbi:MAG: hypothetical protein JWQ79_2621 [Mucilaginibacter sp.]|jgi:hypothetical protein|nr:hypothetical protein [Mucilaginibacter sp.]
MALKLKPDMILTVKPGITPGDLKEAITEYTGIKIIEALELILKDLPAQQKNEIMAKVDGVLEMLL